jgi:hypothetical protein
MRNFNLLWAAAVTAILATGCATAPAVFVDREPGVDLRAYQTFAFFPDPQPGYSTLLSEHVKRATRRELESRGYRYDDANPDLRVAFALKVDERQELRSTPAFGPGPFLGGYGAYEIDTVDYKAGTLTIHLVDTTRSQLVWQGVAEGRVRQDALKNPATAISAVVAEIFVGFTA